MTGTADRFPPPVAAQQCVFIREDGKGSVPPPPAIPFNENSRRALSKRNRVYVMRDFLLRNYPRLSSPLPSPAAVLDVAGGRGDLSWLLRNVDGVDSIIADPRRPNHRSLVKSVGFLLDHPEEARIRSVEGRPTHQPLAGLLPRLIANRGGTDGLDDSAGNDIASQLDSPRFMRVHVDDLLVETLRKVMWGTSSENEAGITIWDEYWRGEQGRIHSDKVHYGGTAPRSSRADDECRGSAQVTDAKLALGAFGALDLIVGFHPDQATEAAVDLALSLRVPFAVVPCCVFPSEFPERTLRGERVRTHAEFVEYLGKKHGKIRKERLPFVETETAKSTVLYMLKEDFG